MCARAMRGAIASTIYDCKGLAARFGMAKARARSVPTGVCMSTLLRPGAALDMMHFDEREVARSSKML